jgi:hypothetical protein
LGRISPAQGHDGHQHDAIQAQRDGDFSQQSRTIYDPFTSVLQPDGSLIRTAFPGNIIPRSRINPAIKFFLDTMMPLPNRPGFSNNLVNTESNANDRDLWNVRLDHTFGSKDNVFFRWSNQNVGENSPSANPNLFGTQRFDVRSLATAWNHIFGATSVLEVKFGYNNPANPGATLNRKISRGEFFDKTGIKMYQREDLFDPLPTFNAVGEFSYGGGGDVTEDHIYQFISNFSKVVGRHSLKTGINYSYRQFFTNTSNPMNGDAIFDRRLTSLGTDNNSGHSFATMLLGTPTEIRRGKGNTTTEGRIRAPQIYIQDDWRATSRLTINLGLRYEFSNPPYDITDRLGNLWVRRDPQSGHYYGTLLWATTNPEEDPETGKRNQPAKQGGFGRSLKKSNYLDFAPRIGLAYQLNGKTVVRAAYGIFYNSTSCRSFRICASSGPSRYSRCLSPIPTAWFRTCSLPIRAPLLQHLGNRGLAAKSGESHPVLAAVEPDGAAASDERYDRGYRLRRLRQQAPDWIFTDQQRASRTRPHSAAAPAARFRRSGWRV